MAAQVEANQGGGLSGQELPATFEFRTSRFLPASHRVSVQESPTY